MILVSSVCLISCGNVVEDDMISQKVYITAEDIQEGVNAIYPEGFTVDDTSLLDDVLKAEYDLKELKDFFQSRCANSILENKGGIMYFDEVNEMFPIEIIRPQGYSVYKVSQGGYFYVFWSKGVCMVEDEKQFRPVVYFVAHLESQVEEAKLETLKKGKSTANDVRKLDLEVEFNFARSCGTFSYSYLNKDEIMEIEYTISDKGLDNYDDMVIKDITIIPRTEGSTRFKSILEKDLP